MGLSLHSFQRLPSFTPFFLALISCFPPPSAVLPSTGPLVVSLILTARGAALRPSSGSLAPLVEQRIAGGVEVFDFHLIVIHTHGGQSAGHLLL